MADWIKLRSDITRDPRVIRIADELAESRPFMDWLTAPFGPAAACRESAYERVTRCVTVSVTVTALVRVWSTVRTQGRVRGEDVHLDFATLPTLDVIAEVPDFGYAMAAAEWVEERADGGGLIFPKFLKQNATPEDRKKEQAAARKQRQRERDRSVTPRDRVRDTKRDAVRDGHADVTHRVEESREEENKTDGQGGLSVGRPDFDPLREEERVWKEFVARWNAAGLKPVGRLSQSLRKDLLGLMNDGWWAEHYHAAILRAAKIPFLAAGVGRDNGRLDVSTFLRDDDFVRKVLDGVYDPAADAPRPAAAPPVRYGPPVFDRQPTAQEIRDRDNARRDAV